MELQVGVKILLKNRQGKFLLLRRNPKKYPEVGAKWDIVGGRIIPGTPLLENLKREIKEEVGLELSSDVNLLAAQDIFVHRCSDHTDNTDAKNNNIQTNNNLYIKNVIPISEIIKHVVRLTYIGNIEGDPVIDEESLEAKWFSAEEILELDKNILDSYFRELIVSNKIEF